MDRSKSLTLDSAGKNAFDDVLLHAEVENDNRCDGNDHARHDGAPFALTTTGVEVLNDDRNGLVFLCKYKAGEQEVVPDPHCLQNTDRDDSGFHDWHDNIEEGFYRTAAVDHGGFLNVSRKCLQEVGEHEQRRSCAESEVNNGNVDR